MRDPRVTSIAQQLQQAANSPDELSLLIQRWVHQNHRYIEDIQNQGQFEFVQMPLETIQKGIGDCEDFAILMMSLLWHSGIHDAREVLGYVDESHRWVEVQLSNGWHVLDPTNGAVFPIEQRQARGYKPMWYVTPFSVQSATLPLPPLLLP